MADKYVLVEFISSVNNALSQTFQSMQRIKLTCFDVSNNYIVFGASSGGIYIFARKPCQFIKLIPSKEGSATNVIISPNEKKLAISSSKGLIIILENIYDLNYEVYSEHEGQVITALKWHNDDLFCGDNSGKVSVTSVTNLLAKAIFQSSSTSLMHLDSSIVQIDCFSKYLLISTQTRAYFCDTEREQYRQIGKKLREGPYGACFFNITSNADQETITHTKGLFQTIGEDDQFKSTNTDVKIYCARPGARLWEVNFEATVLKTHQFKTSFAHPPSDIIHISDSTEERLNISKFTNVKSVDEDFNFGKLLNVFNKFILTYDKNGIFVFDPAGSSLLFWTNSMKNIRDVRIVNSLLYIWRDSLQINVLSLIALEDIVLKTLLRKQYYLCTELCLHYSEEINSLVESSSKIYLISSLKSKLLQLNEPELLQRIDPTLNKIKEFSSNRLKSKKLENGIVVIDNAYAKEHSEVIPESVQTFVPSCSSSSKQSHDDNIQVYTMYKQYKLHETHKNIDIPDFCKIFDSTCIYPTIQKFIEYSYQEHGLNSKSWCQEQTLKQLSKKCIHVDELDEDFKVFLKEAYMDVNSNILGDCVCECSFPLPKLHNMKPKYYTLGCKLLVSDNSDTYIKRIPYMYRNRLEKLEDLDNIYKNLSLLIQFSDIDVLKLYLFKFTYDTWDEAVKYLINLKKGKCLNCGEEINPDCSFSWTALGLLMVQSIGSQNSTKLFKRYAPCIPNGELDVKFYQACIFSAVANIEPHFENTAVNFLDEILNSNSSCEFEKNIKTYLKNKHMGYFGTPLPCSSSIKVSNCNYCNLPMNTLIINDPSRLPCGHTYHNLCLNHNNNMCYVCNASPN